MKRSGTPRHNTTDQTPDSGLVSRRRARHFTIAITARSLPPAIQETIKSITRYLDEQAPGQFSCVLFDGKGDEKRLFNYTTQIIQSYTMPYDALVTIGAQASQLATRASLLLNVRIPIVFAGVQNPAHLGIIYPGNRQNSNVTGIAAGNPNFQETLAQLVNLKKGVRRVLLPYNPKGAWLAHQAAEFARLFCSKEVDLHALPVTSPEDVRTKILPYMHDVDTIMTMRDDIVISSMDSIVKTCNSYGVTVYSADLESVAQGAALGFSLKDDRAGIEIGEYLLSLFKDDAAPHELPVKTARTSWFVGINENSISKQGVSLSAQELETIENKVIYRTEDNDGTTT